MYALDHIRQYRWAPMLRPLQAFVALLVVAVARLAERNAARAEADDIAWDDGEPEDEPRSR